MKPASYMSEWSFDPSTVDEMEAELWMDPNKCGPDLVCASEDDPTEPLRWVTYQQPYGGYLAYGAYIKVNMQDPQFIIFGRYIEPVAKEIIEQEICDKREMIISIVRGKF